jgi:hypothetical protein
MLSGYLHRRSTKRDRKAVGGLISIAEQARQASPEDLDRLEKDLHRSVADLIESGAGEQGSTVALAVSHARSMLESRRAQLAAGARGGKAA